MAWQDSEGNDGGGGGVSSDIVLHPPYLIMWPSYCLFSATDDHVSSFPEPPVISLFS